MNSCYLGLGSNLNRPKQQIYRALKALKKLPCSHLKKISPIYQSRPAGVSIQPLYCNAVALIETNLPAHRLLAYCQHIEKQQKRLRLKHFNARTIDIDILLYDSQTIQSPDLIIPHPRLHLRDFVLTPLLDIWPEAHLPNHTYLTESLKALTTHYLL
ncbi:MAG: 2-amino-4-hydroxy-6-hydroxymethyldihydropteridine diphosphokinase [Legionellaceae bacterium]|nr:2-amino-4-hydroxy-6-hydroxymethyldihydropteridine diphosphokinase [Legionellaceae bacterium]